MEVRSYFSCKRSRVGIFAMSDLAQAIYQGKVEVEGAAGLRNPLVKMTTVAAPLMVVLFQHIARVFGNTRFSSAEIVMIAIICYIAVTINFEGRYFNRFISRSAKWTSFVLIVFVLSLPTYEQYQEYLAFFGRAFHLLYAAMTLYPLLGKPHDDIAFCSDVFSYSKFHNERCTLDRAQVSLGVDMECSL